MTPEFRLRLETKKKDATKVTYRFQRLCMSPTGRPSWRMTLWRMEWFPRLKTWRIIETTGNFTRAGHTYWEPITRAELGNISEESACEVAIMTALLNGLE